MRKKINPYFVVALVYVGALLLFSLNAKAVEPYVDTYQGKKPGTTVILLEWPDQSVDTLTLEDDYMESEKGVEEYRQWFSEKYRNYHERPHKKAY